MLPIACPPQRFNGVFHCVSLKQPCCWQRCLNLGGRTHSAAAVYITTTPVKNTPPSHGSTVAAVQLKNTVKNKYRNLKATAGSQGLFMLSMNQQIIPMAASSLIHSGIALKVI